MRVAIATSSRSANTPPAAWLASRATFSSPSRFLLPVGDQSAPRPILTPAVAASFDLAPCCRRAAGWTAATTPSRRRGGPAPRSPRGCSAGAVDAGERVGERPVVRAGELEGEEVRARRVVGALAEVQDVAALAPDGVRGSPRRDAPSTSPILVPAPGRSGSSVSSTLRMFPRYRRRAPLLEKISMPWLVVVPAIERLALDVAHHRGHELGVGPDELHRAADQPAVVGRSRCFPTGRGW